MSLLCVKCLKITDANGLFTKNRVSNKVCQDEKLIMETKILFYTFVQVRQDCLFITNELV